MAALGSIKGQLWLHRNHRRLRIPLRAHLGATIHFQAGTVKRAPYTFQKLGLEWLWRIKEEPYLWKRYFHDGSVLLNLLLTRVLPLAISVRLLHRRHGRNGHDLVIKQTYGSDFVTLSLSGFAIGCHVDKVVTYFRVAMTTNKQIVIDFSETCAVDARFLGLLLMLRKQLKARNTVLRFTAISRRLERMFRLNGCGYLLPDQVEKAAPGWNRGPAIDGRLPPSGETVPISPLDEEPNRTGEILPARRTRTEHPRVRRAL